MLVVFGKVQQDLHFLHDQGIDLRLKHASVDSGVVDQIVMEIMQISAVFVVGEEALINLNLLVKFVWINKPSRQLGKSTMPRNSSNTM